MTRQWKWVLGVVVGLVVAVPLGTWVYLNVIEEDAPPPLTLDTAASGQAATSTSAPTPSTSTSTTATAVTGVTTATTAPPAASAVSGGWHPTTGSVLGYRVKEVLFGQSNEAVGRTSDVTGSMTINGATVSAV